MSEVSDVVTIYVHPINIGMYKKQNILTIRKTRGTK